MDWKYEPTTPEEVTLHVQEVDNFSDGSGILPMEVSTFDVSWSDFLVPGSSEATSAMRIVSPTAALSSSCFTRPG